MPWSRASCACCSITPRMLATPRSARASSSRSASCRNDRYHAGARRPRHPLPRGPHRPRHPARVGASPRPSGPRAADHAAVLEADRGRDAARGAGHPGPRSLRSAAARARDLPGLELVDGDAHPEIQAHADHRAGLQRLRWRRYEIESYSSIPPPSRASSSRRSGAGAAPSPGRPRAPPRGDLSRPPSYAIRSATMPS